MMTLKNLNLKTIGLAVAVIASLASTNNSMAMESNCSSEHPKTILSGGLREIEPGCLFVGENFTPNGTPIYYAYEKVDESNFEFWRHYEQRSDRMSQIFTSLCRYAETPTKEDEDKKLLQTVFDFTSEELDTFCRELAPKLIKHEVFTGSNSMHNGIAGMWQALQESTAEVQKYVFYASKSPITKRYSSFERTTYLDSTSSLEKSIHCMNQYKRQFGTIIMSCVATTYSDYVPCLSHFGIFKNPLSVIDLTNNYKDISMQLHGFSAAVQLSFFEGREFMETTPIDSMKNIMITKGVPIEGDNVKVDLKALAKFYSKDLT